MRRRSCDHPIVRVVVMENAAEMRGSEPRLACVRCGAFRHWGRLDGWGPPFEDEADELVAEISARPEFVREGLRLRFSDLLPLGAEADAAAREEWNLWLRARPGLWLLYGVAIVRERFPDDGSAPVLEVRRDECVLGPRLP